MVKAHVALFQSREIPDLGDEDQKEEAKNEKTRDSRKSTGKHWGK